MVSETEGNLKCLMALPLQKTEMDFTDAVINFTADAASINTEDEKRDGHFKKPRFF